jgi:hypothetical protein
MFTVLSRAALDVFAESAAQFKGMNPDRVNVWLNDLKDRAKTFPDKLTEYFLGTDEQISRTLFEEKLWKGYLGDIMLTFSLRRIIEHLEPPPKYSNPFRR